MIDIRVSTGSHSVIFLPMPGDKQTDTQTFQVLKTWKV